MSPPSMDTKTRTSASTEDVFGMLTSSMKASVLESLMALGLIDALPLPGSVLCGVDDIITSHGIRANAVYVERLLNFLVDCSFIECRHGRYRHTTVSAAYISGEETATLFKLTRDEGAKIADHLCPWLEGEAKRGPPFQAPGSEDNPATFREGRVGQNFFELLPHGSKRLKDFNNGLAAMRKVHPQVGFYDFAKEYRLWSKDPKHKFLVDVGGADGRFVAALLNTYENLDPSSVVIQDLPDPIAAARQNGDIPESVVLQEHDFFEPQLVQQAHIYHIRACLHDFDDQKCERILRNLVLAISRDSVLLIAENVKPEETRASGQHSGLMDVWMSFFGGEVRTLERFERLFDASGLELRRMHHSGKGEWQILEVGRKMPTAAESKSAEELMEYVAAAGA